MSWWQWLLTGLAAAYAALWLHGAWTKRREMRRLRKALDPE